MAVEGGKKLVVERSYQKGERYSTEHVTSLSSRSNIMTLSVLLASLSLSLCTVQTFQFMNIHFIL